MGCEGLLIVRRADKNGSRGCVELPVRNELQPLEVLWRNGRLGQLGGSLVELCEGMESKSYLVGAMDSGDKLGDGEGE